MATTPHEAAAGERSAIEGFYQQFFSNPLLREFYQNSGFANLGYWRAETPDAAAACNGLIDEVLALNPRLGNNILDVACGEGGSTHRLTQYVEPSAITAIGISESQLEAARARAPNCTFRQMDATQLEFADGTFDTVLCIEAAFHFRTRERFLREGFRVLKPGGYLVMSDLLMAWGTALVPLENHLQTPQAYRDLLERSGFTEVVVIDATAETWRTYRTRFTAYLLERLSRGTSPLGVAGYLMYVNMVCAWAIRGCVLVAARKPAG